MNYPIKTINTKANIQQCEKFNIDQYNWGGDYRPISYGYAGFLPEQGFFIKLICEESSPLCQYTKPNDPVYLDSALEVFFQFQNSNPNYLNFEMNANGVLLAQFGSQRSNRQNLSEELLKQCEITSSKQKQQWFTTLLIPLSLIEHFYGSCTFPSGSVLKCNFYKITETGPTMHFASFSPISYESPNFHLPEFFADAVIV